jgi:hypothetical protein
MRWFFKPNGGFNWVAIAIVAAILLAFGIVVNQLVYDDWRCMFAECRIVKGK